MILTLWTFIGLAERLSCILSASLLHLGMTAYTSKTNATARPTSPERTISINGFDVGLDFTYFLGKDELKYGLLIGFNTDYDFENASGLKIEQEENTTEIGAFFKYKLTWGKFLIEPSFRLQWYASLSNISPEPRLAVKYNVTDHFRLKLAGGLYSQNLISARSDKDVVNLFYGFLSGPDNLPDEFNGEPVTHALQKASHIIFGAELDPVAVASLIYLVVIHKLEYFLNARIVGSYINARAWELLIAMLMMEAAFGIPGLVAAPIFYADFKEELHGKGLV